MGHNASDGSEGSEAKEGSDNIAHFGMLANGSAIGVLEQKKGNTEVYNDTAIYQRESALYNPGSIFSF